MPSRESSLCARDPTDDGTEDRGRPRFREPAASHSSAFLQWLGEDFTGGKVAAASALLDDIAAFEAEG
jgi:hypothetical protein